MVTTSPCAGVTAWTRYSTLPSAPRIGDSVHPDDIAARLDERRRDLVANALVAPSGSVITPLPLLTSARPASNCGLTSSTIGRPGWHSATSEGITTRNEMNDRSPTTMSTRPPICSAVA